MEENLLKNELPGNDLGHNCKNRSPMPAIAELALINNTLDGPLRQNLSPSSMNDHPLTANSNVTISHQSDANVKYADISNTPQPLKLTTMIKSDSFPNILNDILLSNVPQSTDTSYNGEHYSSYTRTPALNNSTQTPTMSQSLSSPLANDYPPTANLNSTMNDQNNTIKRAVKCHSDPQSLQLTERGKSNSLSSALNNMNTLNKTQITNEVHSVNDDSPHPGSPGSMFNT